MNIKPQALTAAAFAPYGEAIIPDPARALAINNGTCTRYDDLTRTEVDAGGAVGLSLFRAAARQLPLRLELLERHPHGSQAFIPLRGSRCCMVVAGGDGQPDLASLDAFLVEAGQGINLRRGVWHHPLIALDKEGDFLAVDRVGPGSNLEIHQLAGEAINLTHA